MFTIISKYVFSCLAGVDDAESECALDKGVTFDHVIINNGHGEQLENDLIQLQRIATEHMTEQFHWYQHLFLVYLTV